MNHSILFVNCFKESHSTEPVPTICKDSFIEKELADDYSDVLYTVNLAGRPGFVYILFEHKSWHDKYVRLQLLEYMVKIWRLFLKQQPEKQVKAPLPIIIPHSAFRIQKAKSKVKSKVKLRILRNYKEMAF